MVVIACESREETQPILKQQKSLDGYSSCPVPYTSAKPTNLQMEDPKDIMDQLIQAINRNDSALARNYVEVLAKQINKNTVLYILSRLNQRTSPENLGPSAPPAPPPGNTPHGTEDHQNDSWVKDLLDNVRNRCLLEIDKNADYVFGHIQLLKMNQEELLDISTRDTLEVSTELNVYWAIMKWGLEQQRRRAEIGLELDLNSILGELKYAPRYGLMTKQEFLTRVINGIQGPDRSGILREDEIQQILNYIKNKNKKNVQPLPFKGSQPRRRRENPKSKSVNPACEKHLLNFLTCWTAVFD